MVGQVEFRKRPKEQRLPLWEFNKPSGIIHLSYFMGGVLLFTIGYSPFMKEEALVLFENSKLIQVFAGWAFTGNLYYAMVNLKVDKRLASAISMLGYLAFDVMAVLDEEHFTDAAKYLIVADSIVLVAALLGYKKVGSVVFFVYTIMGWRFLKTGKSIMITKETDIYDTNFIAAWVAYSVVHRFHFAMGNCMPMFFANFLVGWPLVMADVWAILHKEYWTSASYGYAGLDLVMALGSILVVDLEDWYEDRQDMLVAMKEKKEIDDLKKE